MSEQIDNNREAPLVLVAGGGGYLGGKLARVLMERGARVRVLDRICRHAPDGAECLEGDIADPGDAFRAARGCRFAFNTATTSRSIEPGRREKTNVFGPRALAEACANAGVERLIHVSSAEVYGKPDRVPVKETAPLNPASAVGKDKLRAEELLRDFQKQSGLGVTILRPTILTGADCPNPLLWSVFERVRRGRGINLIGEGTKKVQFLDADECIAAMLAAAEDPAPLGVYNLAGPDAVTLREMCRILVETAGTESQVRPRPAPEFGAGRVMLSDMRLALLGTHILRADADFVLNVRAARDGLGWSPRSGAHALLARSYQAHVDRVTRP